MKKKNILIIILVFAAVASGSYLAFQQLLGEEKISTTAEKIELENYANQVRIDNVKLSILDAKIIPDENIVELEIDYGKYDGDAPGKKSGNELDYGGENTKSELAQTQAQSDLVVTKETYESAKKTPGTVLVVKEKTIKRETPPYWLFSISIAVIISAILGVGLLSKQELRGNAASKLLDEGLEKLTVRDVEIFSQIMKMGEFTIPELMKRTGTSKVTTWRTVKKLVEEGLVEETDEKKPPSRGLGGRGKPSKVYRFAE